MNSAYNLKDVLHYLMMVVGICALMMPTKGAGFLVLVFFTLLALFRKESTQLVWGLLLANAILVMNGFFAPKDFVFGISHRVREKGLHGAGDFPGVAYPQILVR